MSKVEYFNRFSTFLHKKLFFEKIFFENFSISTSNFINVQAMYNSKKLYIFYVARNKILICDKPKFGLD